MATRLNGTTSIDPLKTKGEIEAYLYSREAERVAVIKDEDHNRIVVSFRMFGRVVQMVQNLATAESKTVNRTFSTRAGTHAEQIKRRIAEEERRRWRVLLTRVKLRLDMIFDEEDIAEREEAFNYEFMPDIMLPDGGTVREFMEPQITEAYRVGKMPTLLPGPGTYRLLESSRE